MYHDSLLFTVSVVVCDIFNSFPIQGVGATDHEGTLSVPHIKDIVNFNFPMMAPVCPGGGGSGNTLIGALVSIDVVPRGYIPQIPP